MTEPFRDPESQALIFPVDHAFTEIEKLKSKVNSLSEIVILLCTYIEGLPKNPGQNERLHEIKGFLRSL